MKKIIVLEILMIMGIVLSAWLVYEHFYSNPNSVCSINSVLDCETVNKSQYSTLYGTLQTFGINFYNGGYFLLDLFMTNAFLALVLFTALLVMLDFRRRGKKLLWIKESRSDVYQKVIISTMAGYGLWLIYVQKFILGAYCVLCLGTDLIIFISLILVWIKK